MGALRHVLCHMGLRRTRHRLRRLFGISACRKGLRSMGAVSANAEHGASAVEKTKAPPARPPPPHTPPTPPQPTLRATGSPKCSSLPATSLRPQCTPSCLSCWWVPCLGAWLGWGRGWDRAAHLARPRRLFAIGVSFSPPPLRIFLGSKPAVLELHKILPPELNTPEPTPTQNGPPHRRHCRAQSTTSGRASRSKRS
jgi:hypothetical protein